MLTKKFLGFLLLSVFITSCCTHLKDDDKKLLIDTKNTAEIAKSVAQQALEEAQNASERADRIFKQSQKK